MIQTFMRWLPGRTVVFIADGSFSAIELLNLVSELEGASLITRLRLDAALYDRAPVRVPGQNGRPRKIRSASSDAQTSACKFADGVDKAEGRQLLWRCRT